MAQNAPGKHYREGLSLVELMDMFPGDEAAEVWFVKARWPDGVRCPQCGSGDVQPRPTRKPQPYRCRDCRKDFSVKTGTLMHSSPLGCRIWIIAIFLATTNIKGIASMKQHRDLKVTQKTAWHLAHRIREAWGRGDGLLAGPVEADESYLGGKRENMSLKRRAEIKGSGPVGKMAAVGLRDRETGHVRAAAVQRVDGVTVRSFIRRNTAAGATLYTDESRLYARLDEFNREAVHHSAHEYVREMAHINGIESFWAQLKRGFVGTFHKFSEKHLDRYVREFSGRHNIRPLDTIHMMRIVAAGMEGKRLRYKDLIADNGLHSGARPAK